MTVYINNPISTVSWFYRIVKNSPQMRPQLTTCLKKRRSEEKAHGGHGVRMDACVRKLFKDSTQLKREIK